MRREDQRQLLSQVQSDVMREVLADCKARQRPLDEVLGETLYHQRQRLRDMPVNALQRAEQTYWDGLARRLAHAHTLEMRGLLREVVERYTLETCGKFNPMVYGAARRVLPPLLGALLTASSPKRMLQQGGSLTALESTVVLQGETEHLRRLHEIGTVVLAPTHVSNLDSVILAFAILQLGLPPFVYGAARDLFFNPIMGFFLSQLGAYSVDRRNTDPLYRLLLKSYATLTLTFGYNNLFFPGGTRSRSGAMEQHLKLGLVGCTIPAYVSHLRAKSPRSKVFVVPATLSYQLVLEAETLVDDFLKDVGRSRYIITDDEFSRPRRVYNFVSQMFGMDSKIYVTIGRGLDPFGNSVDDNGESLDPRGRVIDSSRYVYTDGAPSALSARDREYTRDLGDSLIRAYSRDNVLQSTHVTARVVFALLRSENPQSDLLRLIRVGGRHHDFALRDVYTQADLWLRHVRALSNTGVVRLSPAVAQAAAEDVVSDGLRHFAIYHRDPPAIRVGDRVRARDRALLFYYQNRLEGYPQPEWYDQPSTLAVHRHDGGGL